MNFPELHRVIMNLKSWLRGVHHHVEDLQDYLNEYCYRFNRSLMKETLFENKQKTAKRPVPYKGWLPRDPWPLFFPSTIPFEELPPNYDDIFRDWTVNRAKATDHSKITLSHRLWDQPLIEGKPAITLENWGSGTWSSGLFAAIGESELTAKQAMFTSLRPEDLGLSKVLFIFDRDLKHFEIRLDNADLPADRSGLSVEVDLELTEFRRVGKGEHGGEFVLIDAQPAAARVMDADRVIWKGSVDITGKAASAGPFRVIHKFTGGKENGTDPAGPLAMNRKGRLYGATQKGGKYNAGTVYSMAADGSDFSILYHFVGGRNHPESPNSIRLGTDGFLYGAYGGFLSHEKGIFRLNIKGEDFLVLQKSEGAQGVHISLECEDADNLYGIIRPTGSVASPTTRMFRIDKKTHESTYVYANERGSPPVGSFTDGGDGWFYGMQSGNAVFRLKKDGSRYQVLHEFLGAPLDGDYPNCKPVIGRDNFLYGTTSFGGEHNKGVLYRVSRDGGEYKVLEHLKRGNGSSGLVSTSDGTVFGLAWIENSQRVALHRVDARDNVSQVLELPNSYNALRPMIAGPDGILYGVLSNQAVRIIPPDNN